MIDKIEGPLFILPWLIVGIMVFAFMYGMGRSVIVTKSDCHFYANVMNADDFQYKGLLSPNNCAINGKIINNHNAEWKVSEGE